MFKVNNKYTKTTWLTSFWCLYCWLWKYFKPFCSVSLIDFERVFVCWVFEHLVSFEEKSNDPISIKIIQSIIRSHFQKYLQKQPSRGVLKKSFLKICCKFNGERPRRSVIAIKLLCNSNEITLPHEFSPVNLLHIFRTPLCKNISGEQLLNLGYFELK